MATLDDLKLLFAEFPRDAISWRAQTVSKSGDKALALAYIDARDVMDRLDQIVGPDNWQDRYEFHNARTVCYLSIRVEGEWITKADGAGDSDVEAEKGAISDALKRAAVKWGIGRYIYAIPAPWVPCESDVGNNGKRYWKRWTVDPWSCVRGPRQLRDGLTTNRRTGRTTANSLKQDKSPDNWDAFLQEIAEAKSIPDLNKRAMAWSAIKERDVWPTSWVNLALELIKQRRAEILNAHAPDDDVFPGDLPSATEAAIAEERRLMRNNPIMAG